MDFKLSKYCEKFFPTAYVILVFDYNTKIIQSRLPSFDVDQKSKVI